MLTIPETIKSLFKSEAARKNFRVHFPSGEMPDITNENIVQESVQFSESLSSQDVFRFGLSEASVLEFETVGIENMYGMTIEAGIEIDTSSLTAAELSAIQSDPGDGTLVLAADSDIGYGYYRIPYGTFRVDKCPRNHGAMTHRRVTAYTDSLTAAGLANPFQRKIEAALVGGTSPRDEVYNYFAPSVKALLFTHFFSNDPTPLTSKYGYTKTEVPWSRSFYGASKWLIYNFPVKTTGGQEYNLRIRARNKRTLSSTDFLEPFTYRIFHIKPSDAPKQELRNAIADFLETNSIDPEESGYESLTDMIDDLMRLSLTTGYGEGAKGGINPTIRASWPFTTSNSPGGVVPDSGILGYVHRNDTMASACEAMIYYEARLYLATEDQSSSQYVTYQAYEFDETDHLYFYKPETISVLDQQTARFSPTLEQTSTGSDPVQQYSFSNAYSTMDLATGFLELLAAFLKPDRTGEGNKMFHLDNSSPVEIAPGDYEEVWWDEYDMDPIGSVVVGFRTEDTENEEEKDNTATITIGTGASRYDMTDNKLMQLLEGLSETAIQTMLSDNFTPYADTAAFTPTELTMQGWPWIEAGDALQIEAEDGTVINTYALEIEISGIQHLTMEIASKGGEAIRELEEE